MDDFIEIRRTATKGYGVFAKKAIPSYTVILQEAPVMTIKATPADPAKREASIEEAFRKLSTKDQEQVLQLHEGSHPNAKTKATRIFYANVFEGGEGTEKLYLTRSRFNHSCVPNAAASGDEECVRTERAIAADEEITISYLPPFEDAMTARQRATILHLHYHFKCHCPACWPPNQSWKSDVRRQLIGFISYALVGQNTPDFRPLNVCQPMSMKWPFWPPRPTPSGRVLTPVQEIEYNFLLGNLRQAEGLPNHLAAEGYLQASRNLMYHQRKYETMSATKDIIFLEAARCIEAWYKKGLELEEKYYSPGHQQIRDGKKAWTTMVSRIPCLEYLRQTTRMKARGEYRPSKNGGDFAVLVNKADGSMTSLSQLETADLIRQRSRPRRG
ncbi:hypothetical protein PRZ48_010387 [Zasmidium cellare]|uniref:SET domain-containing protein n=1 Tax=Zasmidium cellare TaxID=395010 RepID=A0ABR0E8H8_ZASCE|nr:hypothetical protein PRZ48_010387 [Zasmidium cellare]